MYFIKGRQERGLACPGGVRSRMLRSPKHSAATLWLWTVAAPSSLPPACRKLKVPLGCAPGFPAEDKGLLNILPKPPPGQANPLSWLFFVSVTKQGVIWFVLYENNRDCVVTYS